MDQVVTAGLVKYLEGHRINPERLILVLKMIILPLIGKMLTVTILITFAYRNRPKKGTAKP